MSSSRVLARSTGSVLRSDVCAFCLTRQLLPIGYNSAFCTPTKVAQFQASQRGYAQKLDVKRLRADVDKRGRLGWYKMTKDQKILLLEPSVAEAIYNDFVAHKDRKEYGKVIKQLLKKYNVTSEHISGLAMMTYSIPDLSDATKRAMLPPSPHKTIAGQMLHGCAEIEDPLAVKQIMTAVYLSTYTPNPTARDIALLFPRSEVIKYRKSLATLKIGGQDDPEALTLHGMFLEKENQSTQARALYEKALQIPWVYQYSAQARHPAQLPITAPWNALGYLLKDSPDAAAREKAKWAFEQGAKKGDDPLSCFEYAAFLDRNSAEWLRYTSKAAASGHREAMFQLALFYRDFSGDSAQIAQSNGLKQALSWLSSWRKGSAEKLAVEWFEAAGLVGHKAALFQLAEWYEGLGEKGRAREMLQRIVEAGEGGKEEEFAQVVHAAKRRLTAIKTA